MSAPKTLSGVTPGRVDQSGSPGIAVVDGYCGDMSWRRGMREWEEASAGMVASYSLQVSGLRQSTKAEKDARSSIGVPHGLCLRPKADFGMRPSTAYNLQTATTSSAFVIALPKAHTHI
jgi:hypothetical protein